MGTAKTAGQDGGLGGPCCSCPPPRLVPLGLVLLLPSLDQLLAGTAREATFCQGVCCPGSGEGLEERWEGQKDVHSTSQLDVDQPTEAGIQGQDVQSPTW